MKNITENKKRLIANRFSHILHSWIGEDGIQEAIKRNKEQPEKLICHSKDFCNANMAMHEAFEAFGITIDLQDKKLPEAWNEVWQMAKENNFQPIKI